MSNLPMHWLRSHILIGGLLPIGFLVFCPTKGEAKVAKTEAAQVSQTWAEPIAVEPIETEDLDTDWVVQLQVEVDQTESIEAPDSVAPSVEAIDIDGTEAAEANAPVAKSADTRTDTGTDTSIDTSINTSTSTSTEPESPTPNSPSESVPESAPEASSPESASESASDVDTNPESQETDVSAEDESGESAEPTATDSEQPDEEALTPEEQQRRELLMQADALYLSGQIEAAEKLYRQAKDPLWKGRNEALQTPVAVYDPEALAPAAQVYWREAMMGMEADLETRILIPLQFLVEQYPEFIPGQIQLADALQRYEQTDEALAVLDQAVALYPDEPDLVRAHTQALAAQEQWMEASIAARQFALLNQSVPEAKKFRWLADEYLDEFKSEARSNQWGSAIANVITGTISAVVTGNIFAPISGVSSAVALLQGEERIGEQVANQARRQLPLVHDPEIVAYVDDVGQRLAQVAGRNEFEYEFDVVLDDQLNAFALPGGKIFVNAGAIAETESEAELAGLLAHELAHTVLSHGFQLVTEGNLTASLAQYLPFGGTIADLLIMGYSRDMERQADVLGTQILASAGYAADGLHNLMVTLNEQEENSPTFSWLSTHPLTDDRVEYTAEVVAERNFNRYQYEGIARHSDIQAEVKALLAKYERKIAAIEERQR